MKTLHPNLFNHNATYCDNNTGAAHNLASFSFSVNLAEASPFTQFLIGVNLEELDLMLLAEGFHKLGVPRLITVVGQEAQICLASVKKENDQD